MQYESGMSTIADPMAADFQMVSVPVFTQWFSTELEKVVRRAPEQYWWVQRRWKGDPPTAKKRAKAEQTSVPEIREQAA